MSETRIDEQGHLAADAAEFQYFHATPSHFHALDALSFNSGDGLAVVATMSQDAQNETRLSEEFLAQFARTEPTLTLPLTRDEVVSGLPTLLDIVVGTGAFETGLYYRGDGTDGWKRADIARHHEKYVDDLQGIVDGDHDEWVARYRDSRNEAVLDLAETFLDLVDNGHVDFEGHGWPIATHIASSHLEDISIQERRDDDAEAERRLKLMAESRLGVDGRTAAHFAKAVKREGVLRESPTDEC